MADPAVKLTKAKSGKPPHYLPIPIPHPVRSAEGRREMNETASKMVVGAQMMRIAGSAHRPIYGEIKRIAKVYKNGNLVLEGEREQWRPFGEEYAYSASGRGYSRAKIRLVTSALREEVKEAKLLSQISDKLRAFTDAINDALKRGDVEEMKRLAAMIDPTPSPEDRAEDRT